MQMPTIQFQHISKNCKNDTKFIIAVETNAIRPCNLYQILWAYLPKTSAIIPPIKTKKPAIASFFVLKD